MKHRPPPSAPPIQHQFVPMTAYQQLQQQFEQVQGFLQGRTNIIVALLRRMAAVDGVVAAEVASFTLSEAEMKDVAGWQLHMEPAPENTGVLVQLLPPAPEPEGEPPNGKGSGILVVGPEAMRGLKRVQ